MEVTRSLQPGEAAPNFSLPAIDRDGTVSLTDYRGKAPLLLGLFRGLYCPFCRRHIAQMSLEREKLLAAGIDTLAIVATKLEHARLYFRFHPARVPLAADPAMIALRAFSVPKPPITPEVLQACQTIYVDPFRELPEPVPVLEIAGKLNELDGYEMNQTDQEDYQQQGGGGNQLIGRFLIDRDGIVRWVDIECAKNGVADLGKFSSEDELMAAVRAL
ncbi:MAG TPA: redoxin domain-containing protein [Burkholderiales bacterium]|nr:redoxin domain-containing protein [Burkholderiales bacterium]